MKMTQKILFNNIEKQKILNLYKNLTTPEQISKQFSVSESTIYRNLIILGIIMRKRGYNCQKTISLTYSDDLAFFVALILGDGWLCYNKKTRNYSINMETSSLEQMNLFEICIKNCFPQLSIYKGTRNHKRKFKGNPKIYTNKTYIIRVYSKILYNFIRPFKRKDFYLNIPKWIYSKKSFIYSFLDGLINAVCIKMHGEKRI
jgi:intein-encoded DNA endonuclease-like protein